MAFLMFTTASLYFLVSIYGESIEGSQAHGLQLVQGQQDEATESGHNEEQEAAEIHNESGESPEQHSEEQEALEQNTNVTKHVEAGEESAHFEGGEETAETMHDEASENQRRALELPLSVSAGIGYAGVGLWMILDKSNNRIPYIIAIVGSLVLLGIYFASRTVGISSLGTEQFGIFDVSVAGLQIAIIATSLYILFGKIYTKGMTVDR